MMKIAPRRHIPLALAGLFLVQACAHARIAGTQARDTDENREIYAVLRRLEQAMQERNLEGILELVSTKYFEDMGTPSQEDDYGYAALRDKYLPQSLAATKELHVSFRVQDIVVANDAAYADIRYMSRAHVDLPSGNFWDSHKEFNRVELVRENDRWLITSGL